jgi:hypothetical protein
MKEPMMFLNQTEKTIELRVGGRPLEFLPNVPKMVDGEDAYFIKNFINSPLKEYTPAPFRAESTADAVSDSTTPDKNLEKMSFFDLKKLAGNKYKNKMSRKELIQILK